MEALTDEQKARNLAVAEERWEAMPTTLFATADKAGETHSKDLRWRSMAPAIAKENKSKQLKQLVCLGQKSWL